MIETIRGIFMAPACMIGLHDFEVAGEVTKHRVEVDIRTKWVSDGGFDREVVEKIEVPKDGPLRTRVCVHCGAVKDEIFMYTVKRSIEFVEKYNRKKLAFQLAHDWLRELQKQNGGE